ncbi:MAG TPA: hypothetical protein PK228_20870 [Saprospiraceae bacterium]|nr:hypothetical protein [Saprospiraceae bacterium]
MKMLKPLFALLVLTLATPMLDAQSKGVISISSSATGTTADYDKISGALKEKGIWELGWSFHAMGAAQPAGLFGIGFYTNREAYEKRAAATKPVFEAAGIKPNVQVCEIYSSFLGTIPATKPAAGIVVHFNGSGMTTAQYDQIIVELQTAKAFPPAGQIAHFCYQTTDGLKVIDIWESAEAFNTFGQILMPILQKLGVNSGQPVVYSLYNYMKTSN